MTDRIPYDLDAALDELAREVRENTPRPGPDLIARVLADAGEIAAANRPAEAAAAPRSGRARFRLLELGFGWQTGAVAAMAVALVLGFGVGLQIEAADLPIMQAEDEEADFFTADSGFLADDFL